MSITEDTTLVPVQHKVPRYIVERFKRQYPGYGKRSLLMRAFMQMITDGRLKAENIKFIEKV